MMVDVKEFKDGYDNCTAILFPDGIGECTESQELHHSADDRKKLNDCILSMVTEELTDEEKEQMEVFWDCIEVLGDACFDQQN
ncbi:hypothetical protein TNCV_786821 [Trichonephila clavipes]|nr:hypothetical protein TNCV_786821 [Trichonephila clavipes]